MCGDKDHGPSQAGNDSAMPSKKDDYSVEVCSHQFFPVAESAIRAKWIITGNDEPYSKAIAH